jgi:hypothetical protein
MGHCFDRSQRRDFIRRGTCLPGVNAFGPCGNRMLRQFGGLPNMPVGQAVGTGRLQFGGVPTKPEGHFTGIGRLQFGHRPIIPLGQCLGGSILRQFGHCPTVPVGQCLGGSTQ